MGEPNLILCGGLRSGAAARAWWRARSVPLELGGAADVHLRVSQLTDRMCAKADAVALDLLELAAYVHAADQAVTRGGPVAFDYGDDWRRCFRFEVPVRLLDLWNRPDVRRELTGALEFRTDDVYEFGFHKAVDTRRSGDYLFEGATGDVEGVDQNLGFDLPFLMRLGFTPGRVRDTMLASQVLHAGDRAAGHALKDLAHRHLGLPLDKGLQTADWSGPLSDAHLEYAARDAELPLALWDQLAPELAAADLTGTAGTEMAALPALAWAARHGVGFDRTAWEALAADTDTCAQDLRGRLDALAPNPGNLFGVTNWNSVDEVAAALAALGLAVPSTGDDALAALDHPIAPVLRAYRAAAKLSGTYGRAWLRHAAPDGRVYAAWKQIGAGASGRMSCKEPSRNGDTW